MDSTEKHWNIPLIRPTMPPKSEYLEEISSIWDTRYLTNMAMKHQQLEKELEEYLGAKHIQLFTNGHNALECILQTMELKGEVITTPYTFASTIHAIVRSGLRPVFCDIREDDFTMDASKIEALITDKTAAILPVHVYGMACEVDEIQKIAEKYGLKVIYDAAHAFGVTVNGRGIASYGDASMFSFHATKIYHTVEGGAVAFQDEKLADLLTARKNFGIGSQEAVDYIAGNAKMDEFRAAMGLCNLKHIEETLCHRRRIGKRYHNRLSKMSGIQILPEQEGVENNYAYYPIILRDSEISRDVLYEKLAAYGVHTRKYFYPLCCDFSCYRQEYGNANVPTARYAADHVLCLPIFSEMRDEEVDYVCDMIEKLL